MIPSTWDELRIQARILESEIDAKLAAFGKIGARPIEHKHPPRFSTSGIFDNSSSTQTSTCHEHFDANFSVMCTEIEEQLQNIPHKEMAASAEPPTVFVKVVLIKLKHDVPIPRLAFKITCRLSNPFKHQMCG
ncbi:unnamed protein product [Trichobilharzia regenti]|nr:unnamed protein product [Trichobilharzia regenti]